VSGDRTIAVSIADNSIENSRRLNETAGECAADLVVLSCPGYFPNSRAMLLAYLEAIADFASADLCLYDNPIASNTLLEVDDLGALARAVPRLTHVKMTDTALGKVAQLSAATDLTILAGDDSVLWHQLSSGSEGLMTAIPMIHPEQTALMWRQYRDGDAEGAYSEYRPLTHFIHVGLGSGDYPSVVKTVLHSRGILTSSEVRLPLLPLSASRRAEISAALRG
jgi:4-hydroxy-tetrahydrodipicolinate synthase